MDDRDRMRRLVAQAAETSRLLGVDFVPAYRSEGAAPRPVRAPESGAALESEAAPELEKAEALVEAKGPPPALFVAGDVDAPEAPAPARDRVASQRALDEVRARYEREAPHKQFVTAHTNIVFGEGDPCARLMFVGEAPGADEDRLGRPFVGRSGQLLDKMIVAMGLRREDVYIANVLKTRPPDNATPTSEEARLCAPYLFEQIRVIAPEAIVTLGLPAVRTLLDTQESMGRLRGTWATFRSPDGRLVPVMPTYHPAFLLRSYTEENRAKVWSDLQKVMTRLGLGKAR
jgi:uracil-DNA glycosylase family 4